MSSTATKDRTNTSPEEVETERQCMPRPEYMVGAVIRTGEMSHACATCGRSVLTLSDPDDPTSNEPEREWCSGYSELCMMQLVQE